MNDEQKAGTSGRQNHGRRTAATTIEEKEPRGVDLVEIALKGSAHELLDRAQRLRERSFRSSSSDGS